MSDAIIGALRVVLGLDSAAFEEGWSKAQKTLNKGARELKKVADQMSGIGQTLSIAITAPLALIGAKAVEAAHESADAFGQIEARLKSMGDASGRTAEQLQAAATAFQDHSLYDDDDILRQVTATLLTFGNVSSDTFDQAQQSILDLSAALGQDLQSSTVQIGKALNDPIKGITALQRVGVSFTDGQKDQIKTMVEHGQMAQAQAIILKELQKEFGGAAQAARDNNPFAELNTQGRTFMENVGAIITKALIPLANAAADALKAFNHMSPGVQTAIVIVGGIAAAAGPALIALGALASSASAVMTFLASDAIAAALPALAAALGPVALAAAAVAAAFALDWPKIAPVLQSVWISASSTLGAKMHAIFDQLSAKISAFLNSEGGKRLMQFADWIGTTFAQLVGIGMNHVVKLIGTVMDVLGDVANYVVDVFTLIGNLVTGNWQGVWTSFKSIVADAVSFVLHMVGLAFPFLANQMNDLASKLPGAKKETRRLDGGHFGAGSDSGLPSTKGIGQGKPGAVGNLGDLGGSLGKAAKTIKAGADELASSLKSVLDALATPVEKANGEYLKQVSVLDKALAAGKITADKYAESIRRAQDARDGGAVGAWQPTLSDVKPVAVDDHSLKQVEQLGKDITRTLSDAWDDVGYAAKNVFLDVVETGKVNWRNLASFIIDHWGSVSKVIGDVFNQIQSGSNGGGLGGIIKSIFGSIGHNANGTDNWPGGLTMLGERGPELGYLPRGASVMSAEKLNAALSGRSSGPSLIRVEVDKSEYFDVAVRTAATPIAQKYAGQAAVAGAQGGAVLADDMISQRGRNTLA